MPWPRPSGSGLLLASVTLGRFLSPTVCAHFPVTPLSVREKRLFYIFPVPIIVSASQQALDGWWMDGRKNL